VTAVSPHRVKKPFTLFTGLLIFYKYPIPLADSPRTSQPTQNFFSSCKSCILIILNTLSSSTFYHSLNNDSFLSCYATCFFVDQLHNGSISGFVASIVTHQHPRCHSTKEGVVSGSVSCRGSTVV